MRFVNIHRRSVDILFREFFAVRLVVYLYRRQRENLAVRTLVRFRVERVRIGLVDNSAVRGRNSEFIVVEALYPFDFRFPHAARGAGHSRAVPVVEVADYLYRRRGGRESAYYGVSGKFVEHATEIVVRVVKFAFVKSFL